MCGVNLVRRVDERDARDKKEETNIINTVERVGTRVGEHRVIVQEVRKYFFFLRHRGRE